MVSQLSTSQTFEVGETVGVPWGLDSLPGTVVAVRGTGDDRRIDVELVPPGADESATVTFPAHAVELHGGRGPEQDWYGEARYHDRLQKFLLHLLEVRSHATLHEDTLDLRQHRSDLVAHLEDGRTLLVEIKNVAGPVREATLKSAFDQIRASSRSGQVDFPLALIILNEELGDADTFARSLEEAHPRALKIATWRGPEDDNQIQEALDDLGVA